MEDKFSRTVRREDRVQAGFFGGKHAREHMVRCLPTYQSQSHEGSSP